MGSGFANRSAQLLVVSVLLLLVIGIVMLFSTSIWGVGAQADDLYFDAKRQVLWLCIGLFLCVAISCVDYHVWERFAWVAYVGAVVLLAACFVPVVGQEINGEHRWVSGGIIGLGMRFQPSEFAKLALVFVLAAWLSRHELEAGQFWLGFVAPALLAGSVLGLILLEVDIGTTAVLAGASVMILYVGGTKLKYLAIGALGAAAGLVTMIVNVPGRMERVLALLHPEDYERSIGLQQKMAVLAFGSGGVEGLGLGMGRLKMMYMPFAHTDFIFPMIGEELGMAATILVVLCFAAFTMLGLTISMQAPDRFGMLLGVGIVMCISVQAALNIGVTTAVLPNTGLPLPFVSYGGSHLICSLIGVGCLLNIFRQGRVQARTEPLLSRETRLTLARG